ncbi:hypothetical protein BCR36DRAFT_409728 [Piromyces finnis]|uniref:RlpA-like protein double-psi beta-barrel domain-containing protein n=1 Tax=Piromyces finnis TaxID=1754191 RepID=A0A1Y1VHL8_9FUNG|nr:hypothetical protein BCR36DRAFT_409728 [Piromyces finnis]|eukprot:ORX56531.1 hypothetical protein BCR36DRAFT_409728 [Piromyces finnis]
MRFDKLVKITSFLSIAGVAYCNKKMTYYGLNNNRPSLSAIPSCGIDGVDLKTDYYLALNKEQYEPSQVKSDNPNTASVCNKCVKVTYKDKWVVGRIIDKCPGCPYGGLDASPTLFKTLEELSVGVIYMNWEYTDCSQLGKSGTCSNGKCTTSSTSSEEPKKNTTKKTTTRKTTTTIKKTTTTEKTIVKTTKIISNRPSIITSINSKTVPITTKILLSSTSIPTPINTFNNTSIISPVITPVVTSVATPLSNKSNPINSSTISATPNKSTTKDFEPIVNSVVDNEEGGSNYALPITGALVVTGAAGIGLLYAKRNSNNINNLKEKFPEAFSNIKRSISRGSTHLRRSLSNSSLALKRSLSKKNNQSGPHIRTKKEYRESLDAHYPIQLFDPPMSQVYQPPSNNNGYSGIENSEPTYHLQHFKSNDNDDNMRIDFHDSY